MAGASIVLGGDFVVCRYLTGKLVNPCNFHAWQADTLKIFQENLTFKGKVPHISPNVFAVLNTEAAWQYAENNEERKLAKEYKEKKTKNVKPKKKDKGYSSTPNRTEVLPLLQRTETEASEEDIKRATPEPEDEHSPCSRDVHVTIPLQDKGGDEEVVQRDEVLREDQQKEGEGPSEDSVADGRGGQSNAKVHDSLPAKQKEETDHFKDPKKNECADEDGSFLTLSNKEQHENTSEGKVSREECTTIDQLHAEVDDAANKKKDEKNQGTENAIKKGTGLIVSDNIISVRKDDIGNADGISIITQSSDRHLSESGMQYDYSDATWDEEDDENLDGRRLQILGDDEKREYSYSPDPDFSDGDDKKSLVSVGTGKLQGNETDNRSVHSDRWHVSAKSSRTEEYTRAESVVSLTEMVRALEIEEQREMREKDMQGN